MNLTMNAGRSTLAVLVIAFALGGCDLFLTDENGSTTEIQFEQIELPGIDRLSVGGTFQIVVRTQEEYEALIYERYQRPLNDYCNENYTDERRQLEKENPGLSETEIQERLNEICVERTPVFNGLERVEHPAVDFSEHSLLGQDAHAGGCSAPDYAVRLTKLDRTYKFFVEITQNGSCERAWPKNLWILTSPIPDHSDVTFEREIQTVE